jgi:hypothetical protein
VSPTVRGALINDFVHRWPLDGNGTDYGTGAAPVDATLGGGAIYLPEGGAFFNGAGPNYLSLGDSFAFAATEGFTWCAWVRYDTQWSWEGVQLLHLYAADTVAANLIDLRVLTHDGDGELPADSRRPGMQVAGAGAYTHFETSATAPGVIQETAGTWAHLAMTISPTGVIAFWRNGTTHAEWTHSGGVAANPSSVVYTYASMGGIYRGGYEGGTSPLHGVLRDVRLYARVVPGAELATIATGVLPTPTTAAPSAASSTTTTLLNAPYTIGLAEVCPTCSRNTHLNDALYFYEKVYLVCDTSSTPDTQEECWQMECLPIVP